MNKSDLIAKMTERLSGDRTMAVAAVNGVLEEIKRSQLTEDGGVPLATVSAPANTRDDALLPATLDALKDFAPLPAEVTVHLDAGYDYRPCREALDERGLHGEIAHRGEPAPIQAGRRWVVERTNSWLNDFGKLRRCTERRHDCVDAYLALAATIVTVRALCRPPGCSTAGNPDHDHDASADLPAGALRRTSSRSSGLPATESPAVDRRVSDGQAGAGDGPRTARRVLHTSSAQR